MKIPLPRTPGWLARFLEWGNQPIWRRGRHEVRRIDCLIAWTGVATVTYYYITAGWLGALQGFALWTLLVMIALWIL